MPKAIIFDADGMIIHGERFSKRLEVEYGISTDITGSFFKGAFQLCLIGKADLKEELLKVIDAWGWKDEVDALINFWFDPNHSQIDARFEPVITELRTKGIKSYLATNNEKYRTDNLINDRKLGEWFDGVFSSAYVGAKKPETAFFEQVLKAIGMPKEEIVFWDDDEESIAGARAFGFQTHLYIDFDQFKKENETN
jgi:putative hydrolase of the HAD superfamily